MRLRRRSLEARLIAVSLGWIVLALGLAAFVLSGLYREHVEREHAERIGGYLEELAAALDVTAEGTLALQRDLSDPLFRRPYSGLYWDVTVDGRTVLHSRSLWDHALAQPAGSAAAGTPVMLRGPERQQLRAWTRTAARPAVKNCITTRQTTRRPISSSSRSGTSSCRWRCRSNSPLRPPTGCMPRCGCR